MLFSRYIHVDGNDNILFIYFTAELCSMCVCVHTYLYITHLLKPIISSWVLKLLSCLGYWKQCCYEHWGAFVFFFELKFSPFFDICPGMGLLLLASAPGLGHLPWPPARGISSRPLPWPWTQDSSSRLFLRYRSLALNATVPDLGRGVSPPGRHWPWKD